MMLAMINWHQGENSRTFKARNVLASFYLAEVPQLHPCRAFWSSGRPNPAVSYLKFEHCWIELYDAYDAVDDSDGSDEDDVSPHATRSARLSSSNTGESF